MQKIIKPKIQDFNTFIFDLDGTLSFGEVPVDGAKELLEKLKILNKKIFVVTNNSSKTPESYSKRLKSNGLEISTYQVINSTVSLYYWLVKKQLDKKKFFIFGTNEMKEQLASLGIKHQEKANYVIIGNNTEFTWTEFVKAAKLIADGAKYIVSNPDLRMPMKNGYYSPDAGLITEMMEKTTLKYPFKILGKPNKEMIEGLIEGKTIFFGDRIYTDMACAKNAKINNCLVLSGEATRDDYLKSSIEIDYIINSIADLL